MIGALIIVFREIIEAGLIVGIVLGVTRGVPGRGAYVAGGVAAGVLGAAILAVFAGTISEAFFGRGQELLNLEERPTPARLFGLAPFLARQWHVHGYSAPTICRFYSEKAARRSAARDFLERRLGITQHLLEERHQSGERRRGATHWQGLA